MELKTLILKLESNKIDRRDIPKIRGYLAERFPQYLELHNHIGKDKFLYKYPVIQYKAIDNIPCILAINEAAKIVTDIFYDIKEIDIKDKVLSVLEKGYYIKSVEYGCADEMIEYSFTSPWMALNQDNFPKYLNSNEEEKIAILKRVLIGNILSMSKDFDYRVEKPLNVLLKLKPTSINYKNKSMTGFNGRFLTNFNIPDYLGIGKSVSRGFGTVCRVKENSFK